jgi:hypothetical protein
MLCSINSLCMPFSKSLKTDNYKILLCRKMAATAILENAPPGLCGDRLMEGDSPLVNGKPQNP